MARSDKKTRLSPDQESSPRRDLVSETNLFADVRSAVESKFQQMEQAHDRIRAEELASRLPENTGR
jgi:hypothetical protein